MLRVKKYSVSQQRVDFSIPYKRVEALSLEIEILSSNSSRNSTESPVVSVSPNVPPTAALVQATNGNMKLLPSVRDCEKVTSDMNSIESSKPKVVPARLTSEPTVPKQQSVPTSCLLDHTSKGTKGRLLYIFLLQNSYILHHPPHI
ncbi:hypothetical protein ACTXT7_012151 [Hymenolepis weldensis]